MITKRRICWPNPDTVCLEGGCLYCNDHRYRTLNAIMRYADKDLALLSAYSYGYKRNFGNADTL